VLVHGGGTGAGRARLRNAALGLARRGHLVHWHGPPPPDAAGLVQVPAGFALARLETDVVLGTGGRPLPAALLGRVVRARCMVLALSRGDLERWGTLERIAWHSLYCLGLVEPGERDALRRGRHGLELERLASWSDQEPPGEPDPAHPDTEILERACERAMARQRSHAPRAAVFLDRDGTLVVERGYLADPADIELLPGVAGALRRLKAAGFALVVISNQSGVGRGLFPASRVHEAMARLRGALRASSVELDAIYFCPHRPEAGCACRKPATGLLERAAEDLVLTLQGSAMVGDKRLDAETGRRAGALGILVRSGYGRDEERGLEGADAAVRPDAVCEDLAEAAAFVLGLARVEDG